MDGVANTPVNQNQPPQIIGGTLGGALNPLGGSLPPANITTQLPGLAASTPGATPSGIGATVNSAIGAANPPLDSAGALDETRFAAGQQYRMPDGSAWRWSGRDLKPADPRAGADVAPDGLDPAVIADAGQRAEYIELNSRISEAARAMGAAKEKLKSANNEIAGMRARLVEIVEIVPSPAHSIDPRRLTPPAC